MRGFAFLAAVVGAVLLLGSSRTTQAAFVELSPSTTLHSHAAAGFTGQAGLIEPQDENDDFGDLSDPDVSSQASASLTLPDEQAPADASGAASARINTLAADEFSLVGEASARVIGAPAPPLVAHVEAVAQIALPFTVAAGGRAQLDYEVDIEGMVLNNEKVTIELARAGAAEFLFREVFTDDDSGTLGFLQPGDYALLLITGAEATNQGVANEQGTATFGITLVGQENSVAVIPLPAALAPGGIMLAGLWAGLRAYRRRRT